MDKKKSQLSGGMKIWNFFFFPNKNSTYNRIFCPPKKALLIILKGEQP